MSLLLDYQSYAPADINSEMMLSQMPLGVLEDNIEKQFANPFEYRKMDYMSSFITKYKYTKTQIAQLDGEDYEDETEALELLRTEFISFMDRTFDNYLDIAFPELNDMSEEDQDEILHFTYRFFIVNIKHNFENLIINYIEQHKKEICEVMPKKKDAFTMAYKKEIDSPEDILILSNLNQILDYILTREFTVEEFLELTEMDEPALENYMLNEWYDNGMVVGNFLEKYFRTIQKSFRIELECSIRNHILCKYTKYMN